MKIAFVGIDGVGKSSQLAKIMLHMQLLRCPVERVNLPNGPSGMLAKRKLSGGSVELSKNETREIQLLFTADQLSMESEIEKAVSEDSVVLMDRSVFCLLAYGHARGLARFYCNFTSTGISKPNYVFYLRTEAPVPERRNKVYTASQIVIQQKVIAYYDKVASYDPSWIVIDAQQPFDQVTFTILQHLFPILEKKFYNVVI